MRARAGRNPKALSKRTALPGSAQAGEQGRAASRVDALRLAQIVNLHIGGYSLAQIGESIGATEAEVDRMLTQDVARYVRGQPALRVFVRNFISERYLALLESVYPAATDAAHPNQLENYDRALRTLNQMGRLHGAEMPTQAEVRLDAAPEMVQTMVEALAKQQGLAYDADVFDAEIIEDGDEDDEF